MNSFFKGFCLVSAGGVVGYFVGTRMAKSRYEELFNEQLREIEQYYEGRHPEKPKRNLQEGISESDVHFMSEEHQKPVHVAYEKYYDSENPAASESPSEEDKTNYEPASSSKSIELIPDDEFGNMTNYATAELLYYVENDILTVCDSDNPEDMDILYVDEIEGHIGDFLTKFGFKTNDSQEVLCVRNHSRGCDYRIKKVFGAFGDD